MPQGNPQSGEIYCHFKGNRYQVITVAAHTETGEKLVIYQDVSGKAVYARPYEMFVGEVDRDKYPHAAQRERFLLAEGTKDGTKDSAALLMDFYDADTYDEKYEILTAMHDDITDVMIDNMAVTLDVVIPEGETEERFAQLLHCLGTQKKYEISRK